jgi:hypothetical protein
LGKTGAEMRGCGAGLPSKAATNAGWIRLADSHVLVLAAQPSHLIRYSVVLPFLRDCSIRSTSYTLPVPICSTSGSDYFGCGTSRSSFSRQKSLSVTEPLFKVYESTC